MVKFRSMLIALMLCFACSVTYQADYVVAESGLRVRESESEDSEVLEVIPFGTEVPDEKKGEDWIEYNDGYISAEWVDDELPYEYAGDWRITAYASTGCPCANGEMPEVGTTIAQNTLPFGTKVYIEGVGVRTVEDRGPDSLGSEWCDLYLGDWNTCVAWGDQTRKVYVLDEDSEDVSEEDDSEVQG